LFRVKIYDRENIKGLMDSPGREFINIVMPIVISIQNNFKVEDELLA